MDQSTLYVDVENLQGAAKLAIVSAVEHWPDGFPVLKRLRLYVEADHTELWRLWAVHNLAAIETTLKGVQHFTQEGSKNSADIALALDVLADLLRGRTTHVAILSDDSDFATLFAIVKQEVAPTENSKVPFKWLMTDRPGTRSPILADFFPAEYVHTVACAVGAPGRQGSKAKPVGPGKSSSQDESIASFIIDSLPLGSFKSAECRRLIADNFPECTWAKADSAAFGIKFSELIWPILKKRGVELPNPNRKPRKYEMTERAKGRAENMSG